MSSYHDGAAKPRGEKLFAFRHHIIIIMTIGWRNQSSVRLISLPNDRLGSNEYMAKQPCCFAARQSRAAKSFLAFRHHIIIIIRHAGKKASRLRSMPRLRLLPGKQQGLLQDAKTLAASQGRALRPPGCIKLQYRQKCSAYSYNLRIRRTFLCVYCCAAGRGRAAAPANSLRAHPYLAADPVISSFFGAAAYPLRRPPRRAKAAAMPPSAVSR